MSYKITHLDTGEQGTRSTLAAALRHCLLHVAPALTIVGEAPSA